MEDDEVEGRLTGCDCLEDDAPIPTVPSEDNDEDDNADDEEDDEEDGDEDE